MPRARRGPQWILYLCVHRESRLSNREQENRRLLELIRDSDAGSGGVYGSPRILQDLRELGEACGKHRVAHLMRANDITAVRGYKRPRRIAGRPALVTPNYLQREFTVERPDQAWVTDITYIVRPEQLVTD